MIAIEIPAWVDQAACASANDPETWQPDDGETKTTRDRAADKRNAKRICATCPVRDLCLTDAIERDEPTGVWGGLTRKERRIYLAIDEPDRAQYVHDAITGRKPAVRIQLDPMPPSEDGEHGTAAGYKRHRKNGEPACDPCKAANTVYKRNRERARGVMSPEQKAAAKREAAVRVLDAFERHVGEGATPAEAVRRVGAQSLNALGRSAYRYGRPEIGRIVDRAKRSKGDPYASLAVALRPPARAISRKVQP